MAPDRISSRTPVPSALNRRMSCRYRTRYRSKAKIEALSPKAATAPPLKVGSRNRLRSNIGALPRHSASRNAASSRPAAIMQPSTRPSLNDRWFDSISP